MEVILSIEHSTMIVIRKEMFYLTTHSTHFIYGYMASDIVRDSEIANPLAPHGLLFPINNKVILYAPSHIQDSTYHGLCYTSRGALAGTRFMDMIFRITKYVLYSVVISYSSFFLFNYVLLLLLLLLLFICYSILEFVFRKFVYCIVLSY